MEEAVLLAINGARAPALDHAATFLGEWAVFAYPLFLVVHFAIAKRPAAAVLRDGWLAWLLAAFVAEQILKPLIHRPRPTAIPELLERLQVLGDVPSARSLSMPSGSAAMAAAGATWIALHLGHRPGTAAWVLALLIGLARVYAGVHWPSDVVFGLLLGAATGILVDRFSRWAGHSARE